MSNLPSSVRSLLFLGVTIGVALIFLLLPRRISFILFTLLVVYPVLTAVIYYVVTTLLRTASRIGSVIGAFLLTPEAPNLSERKLRPIHLLEITILILLSIFATRHHFDFHPDMRVRGHEIEWLTGGGQLAYQGLQKYDNIPLWNPYYRQGEPLVDNAFSYILNPFSSVPHLLFGATQGTKYSVTINAALATVGGWFLGWVLGLSGAGRLTLALMLLGKGNMHANFDRGYYQLAVQQVYFPWVIAGTLAVFKTTKRWAIVLTAVSVTLMFFTGNLWHLLPTAISMFVLIVLYGRYGRRLNPTIIKRMAWVTVITIGLCAITAISILLNYGLIDAHPDEYRAGWEVLEPNRTYLLPFIGDYNYASADLLTLVPKSEYIRAKDVKRFSQGAALHFYYSYVSPWWFVLAIFAPFPLMWRYRKALPNHRRVWIAGLLLYVFFTMWGMGGTPLFLWLYDHVPYLGQWRFVPRALGMASFWIAVLVALRFDSLLRTLYMRWEEAKTLEQATTRKARLYVGFITVYICLGAVAVADVVNHWSVDPMAHMEPQFKRCVVWLNEAEPDTEHALWVHGYDRMTHLLENEVRMINIEADFLPNSLPNTIGDPRLDSRERYTERRLLQSLDQLAYFLDEGYRPLDIAPAFHRIEHCIYENDDYAIPYAFTFGLDDVIVEFPSDKRNPELTNLYLDNFETSPVIGFRRLYDTVAVKVQADAEEQQVLTIQELAYPGWEVWVDGTRQPIDIFAKWNSVKLPMDDDEHEVVFMYRPPLLYIGAVITLITIIASIAYLLRLDRFFSRK